MKLFVALRLTDEFCVLSFLLPPLAYNNKMEAFTFRQNLY